MSENLYSIRNLKKIFKNNGSYVYAIDGINLDINSGETLGVVGVSGSGKSTLLHILGTLDSPTEGTVNYNGNNLFERSEDELTEFRNNEIGFVFQFHYLMPEFTALENVMLPSLIKRENVSEAEEKAYEILKAVGLENRVTHRPGELSGGEQQRVSIARAMVLKPNVIFADEPTGNLDLKTGLSILELFLKLNNELDITLILVTHNTEVTKELDRTITLLDGKISNFH
ncbi:MAG: ATP-binding cassette domain-containing protein [Candidatus Dadabacteria bacterium]|nr:ATP-binding cassette domain-containing protein [Candidatus Dadabacteria bacterium]NIQ14342.1 ATP-binding cassette domain-containing protein [Candidatus Dadabacteria bacterium]